MIDLTHMRIHLVDNALSRWKLIQMVDYYELYLSTMLVDIREVEENKKKEW